MANNAEGSTSFDIVVLGGGSGGYACALRAAELGMSVALIEKDKVGGTCLHYGCIPTKALLHAAEVADAARESVQVGVRASLDGIDVPGLHSYKDGVVARAYKGLQGLIKARKITLVEGAGRLVAPNAVEVDGTIGLRSPKHEVVMELIQAAGGPIFAAYRRRFRDRRMEDLGRAGGKRIVAI